MWYKRRSWKTDTMIARCGRLGKRDLIFLIIPWASITPIKGWNVRHQNGHLHPNISQNCGFSIAGPEIRANYLFEQELSLSYFCSTSSQPGLFRKSLSETNSYMPRLSELTNRICTWIRWKRWRWIEDLETLCTRLTSCIITLQLISL